VGQLNSRGTVATEGGPQPKDHSAGLEETHFVIGLLGTGPTKGFVEGTSPGEIGDSKGHQADALLHVPIMPNIWTAVPVGVPRGTHAIAVGAGRRWLQSQNVSAPIQHVVRIAGAEDAESAGQLLHDFNREFNEPIPTPSALAERIGLLLDDGDTVVLLAGNGPDGIAVLRFRRSIWSRGHECYLAELFVTPRHRRVGIGRALMEAAISQARERGADTLDIGVDEPDIEARGLYESLGFSNRSGGPDGPLMYVYERELSEPSVESDE
jgi:ribosomal protein S18 acetylase RimI-like enzyme